jgi:hypothetical protein
MYNIFIMITEKQNKDEPMVRRTFLVDRSLWDAAASKSSIFNISETLRILLRAYVAGLVDVHELAQKVNSTEENNRGGE